MNRRLIFYLLVISIIVHGCVLIAVHRSAGRIDAYAFNSLDSGEYYRIACNVVEHGTFSQSTGPPLKHDTWRTPGYPAFLAAIMLFCGDSPAALVAAQQMLSVFNVLLLFLLARRFLSERRTVIVSGLFLLEPYHLFYSLWLMPTTLFVTFVLLAWHAWQSAIERRHWRHFAWVGVLCGSLILIRPVGVLVPVFVFAGVVSSVIRRREHEEGVRSPKPAWRAIPAYALPCLLVLTSWMARNKVVAGHFALSDQSGIVLAYFKAAEVELWREGRGADRYLETSLDPARANEPHTVWNKIDSQLRDMFSGLGDDERAAVHWHNLAQGNKTTLDSFDISRALTRIGWSSLTVSPPTTVACYLTRCVSILTFPLNLALYPPSGAEVDRVRRAAMSGPYVFLCLAVVVALVRRRAAFVATYFPLACTAALLLASTPQIDPRFRVPMIPLLVFLALLPPRHASRKPRNTTH